MKTLYISDLDGTLLNKNAMISDYSKSEIRRMVDGGAFFSVATARTSATVLRMMRDVPLNVPVVLMNGVCVYDTLSSRYIKIDMMGGETKKAAQAILASHNLFGFWYSLKKDELSTFFVKAGSAAAEDFIKEREKYGKKFIKMKSFDECLDEPLVYYSICAEKEVIEAAARDLKTVKGLRVEFYPDTYLENHLYLELCSANASKRSAVNFLRDKYGFERIVSFGDNLNDLPMFEASDESCAMSNAMPEVKSRATRVIGSNDDDGVVKWMSRDIVGL
ncbi:MAG: HAD-IIB family hydrolase [Clostridiales bacterium]|nr:HAD-IIB family hydrolase [Clostridiales bacterium]